jgi:hypothetical protein
MTYGHGPSGRWQDDGRRVVAGAAAPFLGGLPGVAAGLAVFGIATGFDNVVSVTLIRRRPPCSAGSGGC